MAMIDVLHHNRFLVEEHGALMMTRFRFDVRNPDTGDLLMECREGELGRGTRLCRLSKLKRTTPFDLRVATHDGRPVMSVRRGVPVVASRVGVIDEDGVPIGTFKQTPFSIGGAFDVLDARGRAVCRLQGDYRGLEFRFLAPDKIELARVTKTWAGLKKELFTGADHYLLEIEDAVPQDGVIRRLLLASAICIGMVIKIELP